MQREALEGANTNTAVLNSMKNAADALKAAHKDFCSTYENDNRLSISSGLSNMSTRCQRAPVLHFAAPVPVHSIHCFPHSSAAQSPLRDRDRQHHILAFNSQCLAGARPVLGRSGNSTGVGEAWPWTQLPLMYLVANRDHNNPKRYTTNLEGCTHFRYDCDLDVDNVHDIMDDIAEQHDIANEISNAISNPVGFTEGFDEDELEKELEELEQEGLEEDLLKVPGPTELPAVPTGGDC
ncbi:hypothetical protein NQ318_016362 [Aromia moschata]|uniref:Uncharacterized protein n=1 Tax=Aromia moschata TaxID=1265417 RepID=A0AAV8Z4N0_9CUCU|nr:hypothetical protein NQ318_016362 [Aromia moschata]